MPSRTLRWLESCTNGQPLPRTLSRNLRVAVERPPRTRERVSTAIAQAKDAAGDKNVLVHVAAVAQLALAAGVLDELEIHLIPVLLGQGRRLFDNLDPEHIELERTRILEGEPGVTHMHYRVQR